uniref:Uncharacterized protein n=1 Tax=Cyclopterus lumpus TaxID=8103 RepID=A0A8C2WK61_CYCLU
LTVRWLINTSCPPGTQEKPGFSLTKAVEDVSQHGFAQTEALKENKKTLASLQMAEQELRSKVRTYRTLEEELEHLDLQRNVLEGRCVAIGKENTELQIGITEEEEKARMALARFNTYRDNMAAHRAAVLHVVSQTEAHKELEEKRALVRMLTQKKEELKKDLENPHGNTVQMTKVEKINWMILSYIILNFTSVNNCHSFLILLQNENDALKREISVRRETIVEKREQVQKEFETHTQIKKDIEVR